MHSVLQSPYVFVEARHVLQGSGFIMSTTAPFQLGRVLTFKQTEEYLSVTSGTLWPHATVAGYRIVIEYAGSMTLGRRLQLGSPDTTVIASEMARMAEFYYKERVEPHLGYNKRFLI